MKALYIVLGVVILAIILVIVLVLIHNKRSNDYKSTHPSPSPSDDTGFYSIKYWPTMIDYENATIEYPELVSNPSLNFLPKGKDPRRLSIAIGGGGPRSVAAQIGYTKGLQNIISGYVPYTKEQFVSTSSGGSWFYGAYMFIKSEIGISDKELLGESVLNTLYNPATKKLNITNDILKRLNGDNKKFLGNTCTFSNVPGTLIWTILYSLITRNVEKCTESWNEAIKKMLLEPYGIDSESIDKLVCLNEDHYNDIINRNPVLRNRKFIYLHNNENTPFWLCNSTLALQDNGENFPYTQVAINPLYSGVGTCIFDGTDHSNTGCYLTEGFAGGVMYPPNVPLNRITDSSMSNSKDIRADKDDDIKFKSLANLISDSSFVFGSIILDTQALMPDFLKKVAAWMTDKGEVKKFLLKFLPKYHMWKQPAVPQGLVGIHNDPNIGHKNSEILSSTVLVDALGGVLDAGFADNTGLIALLQRKAENIISFVFPSNAMEDQKCEQVLEGLFGATVNPGCEYSDFTEGIRQVFENSIYFGFGNDIESTYIKDPAGNYIRDSKGNKQHCIQYQLYSTKFSDGGPCYAYLENVPTKLNRIFGVPTYTVKKLLFVSLQYSSAFVDQIADSDLRENIKKGWDSTPKVNPLPYGYKPNVPTGKDIGDFKDFPNYDLMFENKGLGILNYSLAQTNLLTIYTEWSLYQEPLKQIIQGMYKEA